MNINKINIIIDGCIKRNKKAINCKQNKLNLPFNINNKVGGTPIEIPAEITPNKIVSHVSLNKLKGLILNDERLFRRYIQDPFSLKKKSNKK